MKQKSTSNETSNGQQKLVVKSQRPSPLFRLGVSILLVYFCGIGLFLWNMNFRCGNSSHFDSLDLSHQSWHVEQRGKYLVVLNYVRAELAVHPDRTVTFTAAATYSDLRHVSEVCRRWKGPLSVAVYTPGPDFKMALRIIFQLRLSGPSCVRENVTWHMYYDKELGPLPLEVKAPEVEADLSKVEHSWTTWPKSSFRTHIHLPFPANVGRNVAIKQSRTKYILLADLHMYPSANIIPRFLELSSVRKSRERRVYVLPVFRTTDHKGNPPEHKSELVQLAGAGKVAIPIGNSDCTDCHVFPKATGWLDTEVQNDTISVYSVATRNKDFSSWQPYYISKHLIPELDEELVKEGRQDRLSQAYELCLRQYSFHILDNAFLVQANDIEVTEDESLLKMFIQQNNEAREKTMEELTCAYGSEMDC